jgi:hypothetical protein
VAGRQRASREYLGQEALCRREAIRSQKVSRGHGNTIGGDCARAGQDEGDAPAVKRGRGPAGQIEALLAEEAKRMSHVGPTGYVLLHDYSVA